MTGRRLYDHYCDVTAGETVYGTATTETHSSNKRPNTWPFLPARDRRVWNALAKRATPRKRVAS